MKKTQCLLIAGAMGAGKTEFATALKERLSDLGYTVEMAAFANPIKWIAKSFFRWDGEKDAKGRRLLQVIGTEAGREYYEDIWVDTLLDWVENHDDYPLDFLIIDDWRYENEYAGIEKNFLYNVHKIYVDRDSSLKDPKYLTGLAHQSENGLPTPEVSANTVLMDNRDYPDFYDFVVINNFPLDGLKEVSGMMIDLILEDLINGTSN